MDEAAYITFTEPNGRTYDVCLDKKENHPFLGKISREINESYESHCVSDFNFSISVEKKAIENYSGTQRLYSFVGPNRILYRIDHKNESDHEVSILGRFTSESMNLKLLNKIKIFLCSVQFK